MIGITYDFSHTNHPELDAKTCLEFGDDMYETHVPTVGDTVELNVGLSDGSTVVAQLIVARRLWDHRGSPIGPVTLYLKGDF